ncbi:MAG: translocation/assembly module TamB domain-containing protein, partial [Leeuwenhoekiella sp.]
MKEDKQDKKPNKKKRPRRWLRRLGRVFLGILLFFILLVLFIRSPWGQGIIKDKAVNFIKDKTGTEVQIDKLYLTFGGDLLLEGIYFADTKGDTLIYSRSLEADLPLWSMINGGAVGVESLDWDGLRANIIRKDSIAGYNFQFLIDAFAATDSTATQTAQDTTTASSPQIVIGDVNLTDFDVVFNDAVLGIDSRYRFKELTAVMEKVDLENFDFRAEAIRLNNAKIKVHQTPVPPQPTSDTVPLPYLAVSDFTLKDVQLDYQSAEPDIKAAVDIQTFFASVPKADLQNQDIAVNVIRLKNSYIKVQMASVPTAETTSDTITRKNAASEAGFTWPDFLVQVDEIDFDNNNISYFTNGAEVQQGKFNPEALVFNDFNLAVKDIKFEDKSASMQIDNVSFKEGSGLNLKKLQLDAELNNKSLILGWGAVELNDNFISGSQELNYPSLQEFIDNPEVASISGGLDDFRLDISEVFRFQPQLKQNPYVLALSRRDLTGKLIVDGSLSDTQIKNMTVNWGDATSIKASGRISNLMDPEQLSFNLPNINARTTRSDLLQFVNEDSLGIKFPQQVRLAASASGQPTDISANAELITTQGAVSLEGAFQNTDRIAFNADLKIDDYRLDELMQNDQLGGVSLTLDTKGSGGSINTLDATAEVVIDSFAYNNYAIRDLVLNAQVQNGKGTVASAYKDDNINIDLDGRFVLDSVAPRANVQLDVIGANLQTLGLTPRDIRTAMNIDLRYVGAGTGFDVTTNINDGVVVYDNHSYLLGEINARAHVRKDTTSASVTNKMINVNLRSNASPQHIVSALQTHVSSYFYRDVVIPDTLSNPVNLTLQGSISQAPVLNKVFLVNAKDIDTIAFSMDFDQKERFLTAALSAPHINYAGNEIDSLGFEMNTDKDLFDFRFGFNEINAGPLSIRRTNITGKQQNNQMELAFSSFYDEKPFINWDAEITGNRDRLRFHVLPDSLMINSNPWNIPQGNEIIYTENNLEFNEFIFSRENQSLAITDKIPSEQKKHLALQFENFKLASLLNYFNPEEQLAKGNLSGDLIVEEPFGDSGIVADLAINQFNVMDVDLGTFTLDAKALSGNAYDFNAALAGGQIDLDLTGDYVPKNNTANLNMDLNINRFNMAALEGFSQGQLVDGAGDFSGKFAISGTLAEPDYEGQLNFNNAKFTVAQLDVPFRLENETVSLSNEMISMQDFTLRDNEDNTLIVSGKVGIETLANPTFDLQISADDFTILDATAEENELFYGTASFDADATVTGDLQIPVVDLDLTINENTNVTYVLPPSAANLESREGIVNFVNKKNPDAILTESEEESATLTGYDVTAQLNIGQSAIVNVIISEQTGDNFQVFGDGDLEFGLDPNGRMNLAGVYDVQGGHYEMSLYNLVKRRFELAPSSQVRWSGDPFNAQLDLRAIYNIETSASALMASQTSGEAASVQSRFRQELPFLVYLNIEGEITTPKISFGLDMPEDAQGSIGGQVYGRIQQVNEQEGELNRQVFSLLVLNRFYPEPGSDGSSGGVASVA